MAYNYPYGNGQQLNLDWFLNEWKNLLAAWEAEKNGIEGALQAEIDRAEAALADVFAARDAAAQSAANALESKNAAAQSASDASGYLATVRADANTASNAAQNAAQSESNAAESAQTALASKNAAGQSERNAAQSEANANSSKNAAAQSAADALAHKDAAVQSASDALANKNAAAQSASDAEDAAASVEASAEQITTNTTDISNLKSAIKNKAPIIVNSASGRIVQITDGADNMPVKDLTIADVESANVTRTGKNLFDKSAITPNSWIVADTTTIEPAANYFVSDYIPVEIGKTIVTTTKGASRCIYYDKQKNPITYFSWSAGTLNPNYDGYIRVTGTNTNIDTLQIEYGSIITNYETYRGETFLYPSETVKTLLGINNIWSDAGNVNVEYYADTKLYIDNKIAELQATLLENIGG